MTERMNKWVDNICLMENERWNESIDGQMKDRMKESKVGKPLGTKE